MNWPHKKIKEHCVKYIHKPSMEMDEWIFTKVDNIHQEITNIVKFNEFEVPIVSCFINDSSWYILTSERVIGAYSDSQVEERTENIADTKFGNFKGNRSKKTEIMLLSFNNGKESRLEYETGYASMAPIYYFRFWKIKFPIIDKLKG
jgi:hypothetical protein